MATVQALLDDVSLRYRHTFINAQVIVWMNEAQTDLFEVLEIDSTPYSFETVEDQFLYPIDTGIDIDRIKVITIQINDATTPTFQELPFKRNDNNQYVSESDYWYTIIEDNFYVNVPGGAVDDRFVYIYLDTAATAISASSLGVSPATPTRYQELLKLGTLVRVAGARKDIDMRNNYAAEYEEKIDDLMWKMKMNEPEFIQPVDVMPRSRRNRNGRVVEYVTLASD